MIAADLHYILTAKITAHLYPYNASHDDKSECPLALNGTLGMGLRNERIQGGAGKSIQMLR